MFATDFIEELAANGRNYFTTDDAVKALEVHPEAARAQLRRLKDRSLIASPLRSFHVIVPPEYRRLGCIPAEHFVDPMMQYLGLPYYVGLLSAAARHGASHQSPQALQVMVPHNRARVDCGQVRIVFVARGDLEQMPVIELNTPHGTVRYATPELTALELMGYPNQAAGLSNAATVVIELSEVMTPSSLVQVAVLCPASWSQRLGYLLEAVEQPELAAALLPVVQSHAKNFTPLRRSGSLKGASRSAKWKLVVNADLEPDL